MKKLSQFQKDFILNHFFKINSDLTPYEVEIANMLIDTGSCIIASYLIPKENNGLLWWHEISNYIKSESAKNAVNCYLYTFDLNTFLNSKLFKETKKRILKEY